MKRIFKHDFLESYPSIVGTQVFLCGCMVLISADWLALELLGGVLVFLGSCVLALCLTLAFLRSLFEKLFGQEAYLTWSLPLNVDHILLPKLAINLFWIVLGLLFLLLALALSFALNNGPDFFSAFLSALTQNCVRFGKHAFILLLFFALLYLKILLVLSVLHAFKLKSLPKLTGLALFILLSVILDIPTRWLYQFYQQSLDYGYLEFYLSLPFLETRAMVWFWLLESSKVIALYWGSRWLLVKYLSLE
ncbi:hypothetical protein [Helicobacter vulpis]|uniref:hypothetical protein n=1 Tax=Helicobacter vulpis TaxID=2316076 RepID=UPI000EB4D257|nr:hypothetical protein [Helicobacter vulpis]